MVCEQVWQRIVRKGLVNVTSVFVGVVGAARACEKGSKDVGWSFEVGLRSPMLVFVVYLDPRELFMRVCSGMEGFRVERRASVDLYA